MRNRTKALNIKKTPELKRYYKPLKYPTIPLNSDDLYITTTIGDRLDILANQFYKDVRLWWIIMNANVGIIRRDSFSLKPNLQIRIPRDIEEIIANFEDLNKII